MSISVANRIKEIRTKAGFSQEKFAEKINISRSTLALIETGKAMPGYDTLKNIIRQFKIDASNLFDDDVPDFTEAHEKGEISEVEIEYYSRVSSLLRSALKDPEIMIHRDLLDFVVNINTNVERLVSFVNKYIPIIDMESGPAFENYLKNGRILPSEDEYIKNIKYVLKTFEQYATQMDEMEDYTTRAEKIANNLRRMIINSKRDQQKPLQ